VSVLVGRINRQRFAGVRCGASFKNGSHARAGRFVPSAMAYNILGLAVDLPDLLRLRMLKGFTWRCVTAHRYLSLLLGVGLTLPGRLRNIAVVILPAQLLFGAWPPPPPVFWRVGS